MVTQGDDILEIESIKKSYRRLLTKWRPDKCCENQEICNEMTRKIILAYQTLMDYCQHYQYSFSEEAVRRRLSPEQWWAERFGDDPFRVP
jgi:DnaJ-class molecular chaperone